MTIIPKNVFLAQAIGPLMDPSNQPLVPERVSLAFRKCQEVRDTLDGEIRDQAAMAAKDRSPVTIHKLRQKLARFEGALKIVHEQLVNECFTIYRNAAQPGRSFVLGSEALRESEGIPEMINFGVLSGDSHATKTAVAVSGTELKTGGVLCDGSWSVFKNDCVMLGVIHNLRSCFIARVEGGDASTLNKDLFDATAHRPKVLGREIAMLCTAGYRQVSNDYCVERYGHMFVPLERAKAQNITLQELIAGASKANSLSKILTMLTYEPDADEDAIIRRAAQMREDHLAREAAKAKAPVNELVCDPEMLEAFNNIDLLNTAFFEDGDDDDCEDMSLATLTPDSMRSMELSPAFGVAMGGAGCERMVFARDELGSYSPILPNEPVDPDDVGGIRLVVSEIGSGLALAGAE